jgi:hypothetical protein
MIALAYLLSVAVCLVLLAVVLRRRPTPPDVPAPSLAPAVVVDAGAEIRVILAATHQLAARLSTAA